MNTDRPPFGNARHIRNVPGRKTAGSVIAFGHWSQLGLVQRPHLLALDTGCVWGGCLSACRWHADPAQREIFFEPFTAETGTPLIEESWDGGYGVIAAQMQSGEPSWAWMSLSPLWPPLPPPCLRRMPPGGRSSSSCTTRISAGAIL